MFEQRYELYSETLLSSKWHMSHSVVLKTCHFSQKPQKNNKEYLLFKVTIIPYL